MSRRHDEKGAAMVEFAIIVPLLLMLVVGIIEFGRAYNTQVAIQAAAREGARELALRHPGVEARTRAAAPSVNIDMITQSPCPATGDGQARVTITESFTFGIPFGYTKTLKATGVMRCGL